MFWNKPVATDTKVAELEAARRELQSSKDQVTNLDKKIRELEHMKSLEEKELAHLVKMKEEKQAVELQKEKLKLSQDYQQKEMELQKKYHENVMSVIQKEHADIKEVYTQIMERLPNVNVELSRKK